MGLASAKPNHQIRLIQAFSFSCRRTFKERKRKNNVKQRAFSRVLVFISVLILTGCSQKPEASLSISVADAKAEAAKMSAKQAEHTLQAYARALLDRKVRADEIVREVRRLNPHQLLGDRPEELRLEMNRISSEMQDLRERFDIYAGRYRALGGDLGRALASGASDD